MHKKTKRVKPKEIPKKKERIPLYLDGDMAEWLDLQTQPTRCSRAHVIRQLILKEMEARKNAN